jgi:predicted ArsR family transcriptional regulator
MSTGTAWYSAISSYSRVELLAVMAGRPQCTIAELTAATKLHANTVREHLQRLEDDGLVVRATERRTTRGRPRVLYSAVLGEAPVPNPVARRKAKDAAARGDLMRRVLPDTAPAAGTLDAAGIHQIDAIVDHLDAAGFDPSFDHDELSLDVTPCPHREVQSGHREKLCAVHLAMMQGVLAEAGGPLRAVSVRTDGVPYGCIVQLARMPAA